MCCAIASEMIRRIAITLLALLLAACNCDRVEEKTAPPPVPVVVTQTVPPAIAGPKLLPVHEAPRDPALVAYRDQLLAAVRRRDADAFVSAVDPKIRTSFGDGGGSDALREMLARPEMWGELEQVLTRGGSFLAGSSQSASTVARTRAISGEARLAFESNSSHTSQER